MKKTILLLMFLTSGKLLFSQILFKNNFDEPVYVAIGYYHDTKEFKGWYSTGWFYIEPGEKKQILGWLPLNPNIYYYAQTKGSKKKFEGNTSLIVNPTDVFSIKNADKDYVITDNPKYKWYKFNLVTTGLKMLKYTIEFYG